MSLKERIIKEMVISDKEKQIKELVSLHIWNEKKIRLRWEVLEEERKLNQRSKK